MKQIRDSSDERNRYFCIHCGRATETRDHAPSKIFLDEPYPDNLAVVGSCLCCNAGYSLDEEYVACAIQCAKIGSTAPEKTDRRKIKRILQKKPVLADSLAKCLRVDNDGNVSFDFDPSRLQRVILKLARTSLTNWVSPILTSPFT
jgi:hypothetical protein